MPRLERDDGIEIHWEKQGEGPVVALAPYCIAPPSVYDPLAAELETDHSILRYDERGAGLSTQRGPYDMETAAGDLEAVLETAGGAAVLVAMADAVNRAVRVAARRPDLVEGLVVPGGNPAGRHALEGTDAMITSETVVDAFLSMAETDYRGALRSLTSAGNAQMDEDDVRERVQQQVSYQPQEAAVTRLRAWADDDASEHARECRERLWLLFSPDTGGGWFPAGDAAMKLARRHFPAAHVEPMADGVISRPDLTAAVVRRVRSGARTRA